MGAIHQALLTLHAPAGAGMTTPEVEFDARNLTGSDGDQITLFDDSSGNNRDATGGSSSIIVKTNILNGHPVLRHDGGVAGLNFTFATNPTSFTIIAVVKCTETGSGVFRIIISEGSNGSNAPLFGIDTQKIRLHELDVGDVGVSSTSMNTTDFYTVAVTYDDVNGPGNYVFYLNGNSDGSGTQNANWGRPFNRLVMRGGNLNRWKGDIAYIGLWYSVLGSTELTTRFNDLQTVWAHY